MTKITVYRVEHVTSGYGPWTHGAHTRCDESYKRNMGNASRNIEASADVPGFFYGLLVGVLSRDSLLQWFMDCWRDLHKANFVVRVYEVTSVKVGKLQVAFHKDCATMVEEFTLLDFIRNYD